MQVNYQWISWFSSVDPPKLWAKHPLPWCIQSWQRRICCCWTQGIWTNHRPSWLICRSHSCFLRGHRSERTHCLHQELLFWRWSTKNRLPKCQLSPSDFARILFSRSCSIPGVGTYCRHIVSVCLGAAVFKLAYTPSARYMRMFRTSHPSCRESRDQLSKNRLKGTSVLLRPHHSPQY